MINPLSTSVSGLMSAIKKVQVATDNIVIADILPVGEPQQSQQTLRSERNMSLFALQALGSNTDAEFIDIKMASHAYQANLVALRTNLEMQNTLRHALEDKV